MNADNVKWHSLNQTDSLLRIHNFNGSEIQNNIGQIIHSL